MFKLNYLKSYYNNTHINNMDSISNILNKTTDLINPTCCWMEIFFSWFLIIFIFVVRISSLKFWGSLLFDHLSKELLKVKGKYYSALVGSIITVSYMVYINSCPLVLVITFRYLNAYYSLYIITIQSIS